MASGSASISGARGLRGGREVEVGFSLAFAAGDAFPQTGFFVCQQHYPENFWDAAAQVHPNGATGVSEIAFAHPQADAAFLSAFLDATPQETSDGLRFTLPGTDVTLAIAAPAGMRAAKIAARENASFLID